jgi:hypothetical protein
VSLKPVSAIPKVREVHSAHLQAIITLNGVCQSETNLNPLKYPKLRITELPHGLLLEQDEACAFVPMTNVKLITYK